MVLSREYVWVVWWVPVCWNKDNNLSEECENVFQYIFMESLQNIPWTCLTFISSLENWGGNQFWKMSKVGWLASLLCIMAELLFNFCLLHSVLYWPREITKHWQPNCTAHDCQVGCCSYVCKWGVEAGKFRFKFRSGMLRLKYGIHVCGEERCFFTMKKKNSMVWVRERTIPTERSPLVGEVIANFLRIEGATQSAWRIPTAVFSVF
jgi:hypothetical protein